MVSKTQTIYSRFWNNKSSQIVEKKFNRKIKQTYLIFYDSDEAGIYCV